MDPSNVKWGILGSGNICSDFTSGLTSLGYPIKAVAASKLEKAQAFAKTFRIETAYGSYEELANDPQVQVVYVGTVHSMHLEHAKLMIAAGKHVLCEKPVTLNLDQANELISAAKSKGVFFMEAMWTRFFPMYKQLAVTIKEIGEIVHFIGDFGFVAPTTIQRLFDPAIGGGGLLDIGIYPIAAAFFAFGHATPSEVKAVGILSDTGVDVNGSVILKFPTGSASLSYTLLAQTPGEQLIIGTEGSIRIHNPSHAPTSFTLSTSTRTDSQDKKFDFPLPKNAESNPPLNFPNSQGMQYQATAVATAIANSLVECPEYPPSETLEIMKVMDEIRKQIGVKYAVDK